MNKKLAAEKILALLEARAARLLGCEPADLPKMKIGSWAHFLFLLIGDAEVMPGFNSSFRACKKVPKEERASFEELLHALRTRVGGLGKRRKIESENHIREW
jgi:hypothetical protein